MKALKYYMIEEAPMRMGGDHRTFYKSEDDLRSKDADILDSPYYTIYEVVDKKKLKKALKIKS